MKTQTKGQLREEIANLYRLLEELLDAAQCWPNCPDEIEEAERLIAARKE